MDQRRIGLIVATIVGALGLFFVSMSLRWYTTSDPVYNINLAIACFLFVLIVLRVSQTKAG
jgi:hypothetical protein